LVFLTEEWHFRWQMKAIARHIPNGITLMNLLAGCISIFHAMEGKLLWAGILILTAAVLDFFDGFAARLLGVQSPIGEDLDSLADVVSFGVAPAFIAFYYTRLEISDWFAFVVFFYTLCAAVRLAKFNNDESQKSSFVGLPSPAAAMVLAAWPWMLEYDRFGMGDGLNNPYVLMTTCLALGVLMVSSIPMFALKIEKWTWHENRIKFGFLILAIGLIALFYFYAIPLIIILYILISIMRNFAT
jgi:CDP-diacylglycerol--serine O-phosphatidyltransferase